MDHPALRFFIIEKDLFIASDMRAGLQDACAGCEVHEVRRIDDLPAKLGELPGAGPRPIFITNLNLDRIDSTGLAEIAQKMAGAIVVREGTDPAAALLDRGYHILPSPFSTTHLSELVGRLSAP